MTKLETQYAVSILATTRRVRDTIFTLEALEDAARQVNELNRKVVVLADHDHTCPPLGITVAARVISIDGGYHALEAVSAIYGVPTEIELPDGTIGLAQELPEHPFPLTSGDFGDAPIPEIQIDPTNFGGYELAQTVLADIAQLAPEVGYDVGIIERRSLIPDPEVIFRLGLTLSTAWFGIRMAKLTADAVEPKLKQFIGVVCETVIKTAKDALPMNRPITYVVKVNGTPNVDLVVRSRDANLVIRAFTGDFTSIAKDVATLRQRFNAEMVQYILNENGEWDFNFLLTGDGKTIGSRMAFDRRTVLLNQLAEEANKKLENGPNNPMDRSRVSAASRGKFTCHRSVSGGAIPEEQTAMRGEFHLRQFDAVISYGPNDREIVTAIAERLKEGGVNAWFDMWFLEIGTDMMREQFQALEETGVLIEFIGSQEYTPGQAAGVAYVSATAGARYLKDKDLLTIPVLLPDVDGSILPEHYRNKSFIAMDSSTEADLDRLAALLCMRIAEAVRSPNRPRIFLCHAKEDDARVEELFTKLQTEGFQPWYDKANLGIGDRWEDEIAAAIENTDFFAICLSKVAVKKRGFIQKEIRTAIREFQRRSFDLTFLLPIRLEQCDVPNIRIDETTTLESIQWADLFADDERAFNRFTNDVWKQWKRLRKNEE